MKNKHIDLHLLVCLEALLSEQSVTRAAEKMGMSQPGMSNALARLRQLTSDLLLVRTSQGMTLTPRGLELSVTVRKGLSVMEEIFSDRQPFDPTQAGGVVTVAAADSVAMMLIPRLMQTLERQAPGVSIVMRLPDPVHVREWLSDGECDLAIGYFPKLAEGLRFTNLFSQSLSCVAALDHPEIGEQLSLAQYIQARHVVFGSPFSPVSTMEAAMDETLARLGLERQLAMRVSSVLLTPYVVAQTAAVATLPTWLAHHHAKVLPLRVHPLPFDAPLIESRMVWHERTHPVGLYQWVRMLLRAMLQEDAAFTGGDDTALLMRGDITLPE
jgi:DNA-binding transcriptional LysR family regulator